MFHTIAVNVWDVPMPPAIAAAAELLTLICRLLRRRRQATTNTRAVRKSHLSCGRFS